MRYHITSHRVNGNRPLYLNKFIFIYLLAVECTELYCTKIKYDHVAQT